MTIFRGGQLTIYSAIVQMPLWHKMVVLVTTISFIFSFFIQRQYLRFFGKSLKHLKTEDDAKISASFPAKFVKICRIALPTWRCREAAGSIIFVFLFVIKALLNVSISKANGGVLATMLHGKPSERLYRFIHRALIRAMVGLAAGMCSGAIESIRPWLIGCYRQRLSFVFQKRFFDRMVYYQATVLDKRLEAADTVITTYCGEFAEHFAELPYYFLLPGFECITSTYALVQQSGIAATAFMGTFVFFLVILLRSLVPPLGHIHSLLLSREDSYRRMFSNAITNVENIAMHQAGEYTCHRLDASLLKLRQTLDHAALAKGHFEMLEIVFRTLLTIAAQAVTFSGTRKAHYKHSVEAIYLELGLIEALNTSVRDVVVNFRELSHLTAFTLKMDAFDRTLTSIAQGTFVYTASSQPTLQLPQSKRLLASTEMVLTDGMGKSDVFNLVDMRDVSLQSPSGEAFFKHVSISFRSNEDWVIVGENGSGKTSLLRLLCGLWPPTEGKVLIDKNVHFLLAPQFSYMAPQCTLFEQICFPHEIPEVTESICVKVKKAIAMAGAHTVVDVIGGYDSPIMGFNLDNPEDTYDWGSLSGGQKQRISMARVFFHILCMDRSKVIPVAILDEATSMMDETEQDVLNHLRRLNVRMISVTHRMNVIRHHSHLLRLRKGNECQVEVVLNRASVGEIVECDGELV